MFLRCASFKSNGPQSMSIMLFECAHWVIPNAQNCHSLIPFRGNGLSSGSI